MVHARLKAYETGWDHALQDTAAGLVVEAHAPSRVALQIIRGGTLRVRGSLRSGGDDRSSYAISLNGTAIPVLRDQRVTLDLREGDTLNLTIDVERKDRCWTVWVLEPIHVAPPREVVIGSLRPLHLGDALGILVGVENYNRINDAEMAVAPLPLFAAIAECFDLSRVRLVDRTPTLLADDFYWNLPWRGSWTDRVVVGLANLMGGHVGDCEMPACKVPAAPAGDDGSFVACQFDARSAAPLDGSELRRAIELLAARERVVAVGGPDTKPYLGATAEYRLGSLHDIVRSLRACRRFIGVDSGIAHLAGMLGVPSFVVNLIDYRAVYEFFGSYKNTVVVDRRLLRPCEGTGGNLPKEPVLE